MAVFENTQAEAYAIVGGNKTFDIVDKAGNKLDLSKYRNVYLQVEYKDLDVGDSSLIFERSADGTRYTEPPGGTLIMDTGTTASDFNHADFGAKNVRIRFAIGTDAAGTIENVKVVATSKN